MRRNIHHIHHHTIHSLCYSYSVVVYRQVSTMEETEILRLVNLCLPKLVTGDDKGIVPVALTKASDLQVTTLCRLWSGMGHIYKVSWNTCKNNLHSLVIKHVVPPSSRQQSVGDRRKTDSYRVETNFYDRLAAPLMQEHGLNIPTPLFIERRANNEVLICMSHIETAAANEISAEQWTRRVLDFLASFHAAYWGTAKVDAVVEQVGLQPIGGYWYLKTRLDEHSNMPSTGWQGRLKRAAAAIDDRLQRDAMQCLNHGDAKDANVLVSADGKDKDVYLCDFQYTGKGPPTKDLAYFFCTSATTDNEEAALDFYLERLVEKLPAGVTPPSKQQLQESLDLAYCDFWRFMLGWGVWGSGGEDRVWAVLDRLDSGKDLCSEKAYDMAVRREYG